MDKKLSETGTPSGRHKYVRLKPIKSKEQKNRQQSKMMTDNKKTEELAEKKVKSFYDYTGEKTKHCYVPGLKNPQFIKKSASTMVRLRNVPLPNHPRTRATLPLNPMIKITTTRTATTRSFRRVHQQQRQPIKPTWERLSKRPSSNPLEASHQLTSSWVN